MYINLNSVIRDAKINITDKQTCSMFRDFQDPIITEPPALLKSVNLVNTLHCIMCFGCLVLCWRLCCLDVASQSEEADRVFVQPQKSS